MSGLREDALFGKLRTRKMMLGSPGNWTRVEKSLRSMGDPNYFYSNFRGIPIGQVLAGGAASGTAQASNVLSIGGQEFLYSARGTQTITIPVRVASGLNVGMDQADNDGVEVTNGLSVATAKKVFVVGTDPDFFFRCKFSIGTVAGTDDCAVGFRKAEAAQANIDDYDEAAFLNVISGNIKRETILNGDPTTTVDTTLDWADGETHTLEVRVALSGVVSMYVDGVKATIGATFTFDSGENLVPFFFMLNANAAQAGVVALQEWEWGYV